MAGRPTEEQLDACSRPGTVSIPFAGVPIETRSRLLDRPDLAVHNIHHNAAATAEMATELGKAEAAGRWTQALGELAEFAVDDDAREAWHDIDVNVRVRGAKVRVREGYRRGAPLR